MDLDKLNVRQLYKTHLRSLCTDKCMHTYYPVLKTYQFTFTVWVESFNTLRTGDADLRFYITTVQDG